MEIFLPDELERYVDEQVRAGRFSTRDQLVKEALEHFKLTAIPAKDQLLGLFSDEPELVDDVLEATMKDRETRPLRLPTDRDER